MARNQKRLLSTGLGAAGIIDTAKGAKVSDDIQMVYQLDDLRRLFPELERPQFFGASSSPTNAARRGIIELAAPADSAIVVVSWKNDDGANFVSWGCDIVTRITNDLSGLAPAISLGGQVFRAGFRYGTSTLAAVTLQQATLTAYPAGFPPIVLYPGDILHWVSNNVNVAAKITVAWFEAPAL